MVEYSFPYRKEYSSLIGEVYRPVAVVYLQAKDGRWRGFTVYVDSGADITLLPRSACVEGLGYKLEAGQAGYVGGISPGRIRVYVHNISLRLGENEFQARIAFAESDDVPPLLGRADIFDHFKVCYDSWRLKTVFTSKSHKAEGLTKRIDEIRERTEEAPSVTEAVVKGHEEEDEL